MLLRATALFFLLGGVAQAQTAPNCEYPDILVLLDTSGSMIKDDKMGQATSSIKAMVGRYQVHTRFGLMLFPSSGAGACASDTHLDVAFGTGAANAFKNVLEPKASHYFGGAQGYYDTPLKQALSSAGGVFPSSHKRKFVILVSDGEQDCCLADESLPADNENPDGQKCAGSSTNDSTSHANAARNEIRTIVEGMRRDQNIRVFPIGFSTESDAKALNIIARASGTEREIGCNYNGSNVNAQNNCYYQANDASALTEALDKVMQEIRVEVCDGFDNDCDGDTDENDAGTAPLAQACAMPACGAGTQECNASAGAGEASWTTCESTVARSDEIPCNGIDDDCDGETDEDSVRDCSNCKGAGQITCVAPHQWSVCSAPTLESPAECEPANPPPPPKQPTTPPKEPAAVPVPTVDDEVTKRLTIKGGCGCTSTPTAHGVGASIALALLALLPSLRRRSR